MRRRRKRIFRGVVLAFAVAAFTASAAQARPLTKWGTDWTATSAATRLTPQQLAEELRFQGIDKRDGLTGQKTSSVQSSSGPVASSSNGFSWGNAFVGAAVVVATAIILMAGYTVTRRRHDRAESVARRAT